MCIRNRAVIGSAKSAPVSLRLALLLFPRKENGTKKEGGVPLFCEKVNFLRKKEKRCAPHPTGFFARINTAEGEGKHRRPHSCVKKKVCSSSEAGSGSENVGNWSVCAPPTLPLLFRRGKEEG